jgi:hypothetical protein
LQVCMEKRGDFDRVDFEQFRTSKNIVFVDNERLSDKALAMHLICCIRRGQAFVYHEQLRDSLEYLLVNSTTGYIKTLLMKHTYEKSALTPDLIGSVLTQIPVMDSASRLSTLVTLEKYLPPDTDQQLRQHLKQLIESESATKSNALKKWIESNPASETVI